MAPDMDIMAIIQQYALIPVAAACFLFGWLLKNVWADFPNEYIPLLLLPVAVAGVLWLNGWEVTPQNIMAGVCSAALAVYLHQNGKHLIVKTDPPQSDDTTPGGDLNG